MFSSGRNWSTCVSPQGEPGRSTSPDEELDGLPCRPRISEDERYRPHSTREAGTERESRDPDSTIHRKTHFRCHFVRRHSQTDDGNCFMVINSFFLNELFDMLFS